jgi:DNA polymerase-3 subunit gamma/tau
LQSQAAAVGTASLIRTIDELASALTAVREGDDARMAVEIALLKAARPDLDPSTEGLLRRIERLEGQLRDGGGQAAGPVAADAPSPDEPTSVAEVEPEPEEPDAPEDAAVDSSEPEPEPEPVAEGELDLEKLKQVWPAVLDQLATAAPALAAFFEDARPVGFDGAESVVEISFPAGATFNKRKAEVPEQRQRVAEAMQTVTGQALKPTYVLLDGQSEESSEAEAPAPRAKDEALDEEELLERLKSEFDAEEVS